MHMVPIYYLYAMYMPVTFSLHASDIFLKCYLTRQSHSPYILGTCSLHASHMLLMCDLHATHMLFQANQVAHR